MSAQTSAVITTSFQYATKPISADKTAKSKKHGWGESPFSEDPGHDPVGLRAHITISFDDNEPKADGDVLDQIDAELTAISAAIHDAAKAYIETIKKLRLVSRSR